MQLGPDFPAVIAICGRMDAILALHVVQMTANEANGRPAGSIQTLQDDRTFCERMDNHLLEREGVV